MFSSSFLNVLVNVTWRSASADLTGLVFWITGFQFGRWTKVRSDGNVWPLFVRHCCWIEVKVAAAKWVPDLTAPEDGLLPELDQEGQQAVLLWFCFAPLFFVFKTRGILAILYKQLKLICLPCRTCAEILLTNWCLPLSLFPLSLECIWRHLLTLQVIGGILPLLLLSLFRLSILIHPGQGSQLRYCHLHAVVFFFFFLAVCLLWFSFSVFHSSFFFCLVFEENGGFM